MKTGHITNLKKKDLRNIKDINTKIMNKFYVTFRKKSLLYNFYVEIQASDIREATHIINAIFKNVNLVSPEEKFNRMLFYKGCFKILKSDEL